MKTCIACNKEVENVNSYGGKCSDCAQNEDVLLEICWNTSAILEELRELNMRQSEINR